MTMIRTEPAFSEMKAKLRQAVLEKHAAAMLSGLQSALSVPVGDPDYRNPWVVIHAVIDELGAIDKL